MKKLVKPTNFVTIFPWMTSILHLQGLELFIYAIIHGFSQDDRSWCCSGYEYFSLFAGCTVRGAQKALDNLVEKKLIEKRMQNNHPVFRVTKTVDYRQEYERIYNENYELNIPETTSTAEATTNFVHVKNDEKTSNTTNKVHELTNIVREETNYVHSEDENDMNKVHEQANKVREETNKVHTYNKYNTNINSTYVPAADFQNQKTTVDSELLNFLESKFHSAEVFDELTLLKFSEILNSRNLDSKSKHEYCEYAYDEVQNYKPNNFYAFFYKFFISVQNLERFLTLQQQKNQIQNDENEISDKVECPCCHTLVKKFGTCPECKLEWLDRNNLIKVNAHKVFTGFSSEKKQSFLVELEKINNAEHTSVNEGLRVYNDFLNNYNLQDF